MTDTTRSIQVIPPLVTPFTASGLVDEDSLERLAVRMLDAGCTGLWMNGTTGEFFATSPDTRLLTVAAAVRSVGSRPGVDVFAHVGDTSLTRAVRMAKEAKDAGATAVAAITPYYLEHDESELDIYYRTVGEAASLPLIGYHLPSFTKVTLPPAFVARLRREGVLAGFKESSEDLTYLRDLLDALGPEDDFPIYIGGGKLLDISLFAGATGSMAAVANVIPHTVVALVTAYAAGDWSTVQRVQEDVRTVSLALGIPGRKSWGTMVVAMKAVLTMLGVLEANSCAPGIRPLDTGEEAHLREKTLPQVLAAEARWEASKKEDA